MRINVSKNFVKLVTSLQIKKYRQKYQLFLVEGEKIVREVLRDAPHTIDALIIRHDCHEWLDVVPSEMTIHLASQADLDKMTNLQVAPEVMAICKMPSPHMASPLTSDRNLLLDGVTDPGNLGTIIRTADWYGIDHIYLTAGSVDLYNPKVIQSSMGSFFRVSVSIIELQTISTLTKPLIGAVLDGKLLSREYIAPNQFTLVMGSESHGISSTVMSYLDEKIKIPMAPKRLTESLNVSIATGILLHTFCAGN